MLKRILKLIAEGNSTTSEISKEMQIEESAVISAINELRKMGYLEYAPSACSMDKPICAGCPIAKKLINQGINLSITEKGIKYLEK
jgi:predicted transcriptional regulator